MAQDTVRIRGTIERLNVILMDRQYAPLVLASSRHSMMETIIAHVAR